MIRALLDFGDGASAGSAARRLSFGDPVRVLEAGEPHQVAGVIRAAEAAAAHGHWVVGFVAYEAAVAFDRALVTRPHQGPAPLVWFAVFDPPVDSDPPGPADVQPVPPLHWQTGTQRKAYDSAIREIRHRIAAGDVYQVNHTLRFRAGCTVPPRALYDALVAGRHGRYHALIETPGWAVVSASPELFFDLAADGTIVARPMKGTARRGRREDEDTTAAAALAVSTKDRAENLMIVDLIRNDLGRVAVFGSVAVPRLFEVETYPTVHQLTSTVSARLRHGIGLGDVFAAMFPCGSITGAPKVTAMRAIADLEDGPRGPYCGAVGVIRPDGSATFNVAIRTVVVDRTDNSASYGSGGGITWDSRADAEYDEVVAKAALLTEALPPFELLETIRLDDGVIPRLERHIQRLASSARYWAFHPDTADNAAEALAALRREVPAGSWRIRLTAAPDGRASILREPACQDRTAAGVALAQNESSGAVPFANTADQPVSVVCLAATAISSRDRLLQHKTTARAAYDSRRAEAPSAFDVLLFNEEGMATEFTFGNVVAEIDGALVTPPLDHGLLAGALRAELLDAGTITEAPITLADIRRAARLFHINSFRGVTPVVLAHRAS
jgi:para-aminobenzoate synthetase / 4-amino-4-deoxychorismate lyase